MVSESRVGRAVSLGTALGAAALARRAAGSTWHLLTGKRPPEDPADPEVDVREALAWAVVTGVVVSVVRVYALRRAAGLGRRLRA